jgi:hypothetical protein
MATFKEEGNSVSERQRANQKAQQRSANGIAERSEEMK